MKNYYQILNISQNATDADIKRSYRILAKKYHPDVNPGDTAAADKFADINEANAVLSDPKSRAEYDAKLKESMAGPRTNPEDIIARQRAQAQAAARQAARRAQEQAMRDAARQHAQSAQFQGAGLQAQVQALRTQAYQAGREKGAADAKAEAAAELARLNIKIRNLTSENQSLKAQLDELDKLKRELAETERDRSDLEQELFNRDRELSKERARADLYEEKARELSDGFAAEKAAGRHANAAAAELRGQLDAEASNVKHLEEEISRLIADCRRKDEEKQQLEQEKTQADLRNKAQIDLQHEKRRQLQDEIDELRKQYDELFEEVEALREENNQWQQYAKSEQFISDTERRMEDWAKKVKNDRRLAKPTLYGVLGVLIWATEEEIEVAHTKLVKRYSGKNDEAIVAKLHKIEDAYATLSDPIQRALYDESIGISEEKIAEERRLIAENESLMEEYHKRIAGKEFWERFEEINADALSGDAEAQNTLGELYYYGEDIDRDLEQAVFWFKEAAKQKHADAMYNLGVCFVNGEGVEKNETTGRGFIRQAIKLGAKGGGSGSDDI